MLAQGQYSVWFKANQGEGMGVISVGGGRIIGGDKLVSYTGTYIETGDCFIASIKTKRHAPGRLPLFQIDELDIEINGNSGGRVVIASGRIKQVPDTPFNVIMIRITDDKPAAASSKARLNVAVE